MADARLTPVNGLRPARPADAVSAVAAEHARDADRDRRLSPDTVRAIVEAGLPRRFVPPGLGGDGGTFGGYLRDVSVIAEGCASAGWCASLFAAHARMAAFLPAEGRRELWGDGPDALISAGIIPGGSVSRAPGGWSLSGSWGFISGVDFADWVLLSGWEPREDERVLRFFAVPRHACAVEDTWFTVGMRGTGSRTVVLDGVPVPAQRSFRQAELLAGRPPDPSLPCHTVPFRLVNGLTMIAPALGAVRGAIRRWSEYVAGKTEMSMGRVVQARDKASVHQALARSSAAVDAAELMLGRIAETADRGGPYAAGLVARSHRDYAVLAESLTDAIDRIFRTAGARGLAEDNPVQQAWRDVHAATSHAALQFDTNAAVYARQVLGESPDRS